jgi:hypothetical protein
LFAALDIATGRIIGKCYRRHRSQKFRRFPDRIEAAVPNNLDIHLVMDNYATPQDQNHSQLADQASALACAPDANIRLLDQPGRALLR